MNELRIAIIGFGGIARVHNTAYAKLIEVGAPIRITAICDKNADRFTAKLKFNLGINDTPLPDGVHLYTDIDEMLEKEDFDVADVCLPLFLHKDVTVKLLRAGKDVFCEKPMALSSEECGEMVKAQKESGKQLMIGQVLRFSKVYHYLKECVDDKRFGELRDLEMSRLSVYPGWGDSDYFNDINKCGGASLDTHIHDIDVANWILGVPEAVSATEHMNIPYVQTINTTLFYKNTTVTASCAWDITFKNTFKAGYRARFDNASVVFEDGELIVYPYGEEAIKIDISGADDFYEELKYFKELLTEKIDNTVCPAESSMESVALIEAIRKSASLGGDRVVLK